MKGRGFSLLEMATVVPLTALLLAALSMVLLAFLAEFQTATRQGELRFETTRAASQIFRRAAPGGWRVDPDNRGLTFLDHSRVRWVGDRLLLHILPGKSRNLLDHPLRSFVVTVRDGLLTLNMELEAPLSLRGAPLSYRALYDLGGDQFPPWSGLGSKP